MVAGVVAGLVAVMFIRTLDFAETTFERSSIPLSAGPGSGIAGRRDRSRVAPGIRRRILDDLERACGQPARLDAGNADLAKTVATSVTIGSGGSGGVFAFALSGRHDGRLPGEHHPRLVPRRDRYLGPPMRWSRWALWWRPPPMLPSARSSSSSSSPRRSTSSRP